MKNPTYEILHDMAQLQHKMWAWAQGELKRDRYDGKRAVDLMSAHDSLLSKALDDAVSHSDITADEEEQLRAIAE